MPGEHRDMYVSTTLSIVIFTTVVCGGLTAPMMNKMGMRITPVSTLIATHTGVSGTPNGAKDCHYDVRTARTDLLISVLLRIHNVVLPFTALCYALLAFSTKQNTIWQLLCLCNDFIMTTSSSLLVYQCLSALRSQNFYTITAPPQYITPVLIQEDDYLFLPLSFLLYCYRNWTLIQRMLPLTISSIQDLFQLIVTAIFRQK